MSAVVAGGPIKPDSINFAAFLQATDPANSAELEQKVLGHLLNWPEDLAKVATLAPMDFADPAHRQIYRALQQSGGDIFTTLDTLRLWKIEAEVGGLAYLQELTAGLPTMFALEANAQRIQAHAVARMQAKLQADAQVALAAGRSAEALAILERERELREPQRKPAADRFKLLTPRELADLADPGYLIKDVLPAEGLGGVFGPSGSAKTFCVLDMGATSSLGLSWFGHRTKPSRWTFVELEGRSAIGKRTKAWESHRGQDFPEAVRFMFQAFRITSPDDVLSLAAAIDAAGGTDVVVIDTLNRAAPEADENSSADMGRILEGAKSLQELIGGLVLLVHHTGKDASKGMRGHSSLIAALDVAIQVTREGDRRAWSVSKAKDGEDGAVHPFRLERVTLGTDADGDPITSCVIDALVHLDDVPPQIKLPRGGNQRIIYDALGPLFRESRDKGQGGAPMGRPCLQIDAAVAAVRGRLPCEVKRQTERTQHALTGLIASGVLGSNEGWIWLR